MVNWTSGWWGGGVGECLGGPSVLQHLSHAKPDSQVGKLRQREQVIWPKAPQPGLSGQGTPKSLVKGS